MAAANEFVPYTVILDRGALSPAEDLETAIIAAAQSHACGQVVARIERGTEVILEGGKLQDAIAKHAGPTRRLAGIPPADSRKADGSAARDRQHA
jgi:hypothetical protein